MFNLFRFSGVILSIIVFITGCGIFESEDEHYEIKGVVRFEVSFNNPWSSQSYEVPTVYLRTDMIYPCANYEIDYECNKYGNIVFVTFKGATIGDICATAPGPATANLPLNLQDGTYMLVFRYNDRLDGYYVNIKDSTVNVTGDEGDFTSPGFIHFVD